MPPGKIAAISDGERKIEIAFWDYIEHEEESVGGLWVPPTFLRPAQVLACGTAAPFDLAVAVNHELYHAGEWAEGVSISHAALTKLARYQMRLFRHSPHLLDFFRAYSQK